MTPTSLILHVDEAIEKALRGESQLDSDTLAIKGFSTPTIRHLLNCLCSIPGSTYLEVGAWFGGSACAAACNNKHLTSFVVENFAQDFSATGVRDALLRNLSVVGEKTGRLKFIEQDCYDFDLALIDSPVSVFFFDGEHGFESQAKALPHFLPVMCDRFIMLIDDANWESVADGTRAGLATLSGQVTVEREWYLHGPDKRSDHPIWWNGLFISLISKAASATPQPTSGNSSSE